LRVARGYRNGKSAAGCCGPADRRSLLCGLMAKVQLPIRMPDRSALNVLAVHRASALSRSSLPPRLRSKSACSTTGNPQHGLYMRYSVR
jgi:hypothetical protein